jgi:hypothetical protein
LPGPATGGKVSTSPAVSKTPRTPLAHNTSPLTEAQGRCIVTSRVAEIGKQFDINFDPSSSLLRGVGTRAECSGTRQLAEHLSPDKVVLAVPGFKPGKASAADLKKKLEELSLGKSDTIWMDLVYNVAYMGTGLRKDSNPPFK